MRPATARDRRSGQIVALAPAMVVVLGAVVALTAELGQLFVEEARLQNAADAAALAALHKLVEAREDGQNETHARQSGLSEATAIKNANRPEAGIAVQFGCRTPDGTFVVADESTAAMAVRAVTTRNEQAPGGSVALTFAALLGIRSCDVAASAVCEVTGNIRGVRGNVSPFAVPEDRIPGLGETMVFYPAEGGGGHGHGSETVVAGNWGLLNLDGGSCNTPELRDWILYGYDGEIIVDEEGYIWFDGTPGFRTTLENEVNQRIGDQLIMVIYDQVTGTGSNANYRVVGFLVATVLECDLNGPDARMTCRVEGLISVHDVIVGGTYTSPNMRKFQLVG